MEDELARDLLRLLLVYGWLDHYHGLRLLQRSDHFLLLDGLGSHGVSFNDLFEIRLNFRSVSDRVMLLLRKVIVLPDLLGLLFLDSLLVARSLLDWWRDDILLVLLLPAGVSIAHRVLVMVLRSLLLPVSDLFGAHAFHVLGLSKLQLFLLLLVNSSSRTDSFIITSGAHELAARRSRVRPLR